MTYSVEWRGDGLSILDQSRLPFEERYDLLRSVEEVASAIREMRVRGAPAIGVAAAYGVVLSALNSETLAATRQTEKIECDIESLAATRPTAVNLFAALHRMRHALHSVRNKSIVESLLVEATQIHREEIESSASISMHGASLIPDGAVVLTHCNAGMIATAAHGTALGVVAEAHRAGRVQRVFATETRPLLQGARLTVWELVREGVPTTLITDSMVGHVMKHEGIDCVVVGADRIAANGDVANKIGTYAIAVLAKAHGVPFYVAAPFSTIDMSIAGGDEIPIEFRSPDEVTSLAGQPVAASGADVFNPAFDVTPHDLVSAIITERGIMKAPYSTCLRNTASESGERRR